MPHVLQEQTTPRGCHMTTPVQEPTTTGPTLRRSRQLNHRMTPMSRVISGQLPHLGRPSPPRLEAVQDVSFRSAARLFRSSPAHCQCAREQTPRLMIPPEFASHTSYGSYLLESPAKAGCNGDT